MKIQCLNAKTVDTLRAPSLHALLTAAMHLTIEARCMSSIRFRYQSYAFADFDVHIRCLKDRKQFDDPLGEAEELGISSAQWPFFGMMWDSAEILAQHMEDLDISDKRILEVGCGLGLASLVLHSRDADITATDYHPEAENFLIANSQLNKLSDIPFQRCDWSETDNELGTFDLIIGSDVLYERPHASMLSNFIDQHANPSCTILLIDPGRGNHSHFSKHMCQLGYTHSQSRYTHDNYKGVLLQYIRNN